MIQKRKARNGKTVYRVHRPGHKGYFWFENFDRAVWMMYDLINE